MSKINIETLERIEKLAMLRLDEKEKNQIAGDLEKIVGMFDKLSEVDTEGVEPLVHMNPDPQILAADEIGEHIDKDLAMQNSKGTKDGFFTVPKIIK